ncbi:MAG TPA: hypothetical protein VH255_08430 [Verrucomicrobiae bacterium]|jgi:TolB protein|nr:hypothetical protein [Verrucomicrobiae bacterium]
MKTFKYLLAALFLATTLSIPAQEEIQISHTFTPGETPPIKICLNGFTGEVESALNFDLYVMGFINVSKDQAQFVITGSNDANVQGRVLNPLGQSILSKAYSGPSVRRQAHAFADDIVLAITGTKGIAETRVAFKGGAGMHSEIYVSDFDGNNALAVTKDNTIVAAPALAGQHALYYASYKFGHPQIFYHDLSTGQRHVFAHYNGDNFSPAVSPDGSKVAMILNKDGWVDLYVANAEGGEVKRLTKNSEDESSPCWSPDGKWICYATKVGGVRKLCKISAEGGQPQTISTSGVSSPSEPDWSPDGKWIAFTAQMRDFQICVVPAEGGAATVLVTGADPSWSPNSRTLMYVRQDSGEPHLAVLDAPTKQFKDVQRISTGNNSQPSWAK